MTPERNNEIWSYLPDNIKGELQYDYMRALDASNIDPRNDNIHAHILFMEKYFGKHNLIEKTEENPKVANDHSLGLTKKVDYAQYRLKLVKELAVVLINNPSNYGYVSSIAVDTANAIVERLKETGDI